jgi:uncharacterized protein (DUF1810 family)
MSEDPYGLERFVEAQSNDVHAQALGELRAGHKASHWMWFVFPQIAGLGSSFTAVKFAISSKEEAKAYLDHPVLGHRLRACTELVTGVQGRSARQIFGPPDDMKFRSCMTLFASVAPDDSPFKRALDKYFAGELDQLTLDRL